MIKKTKKACKGKTVEEVQRDRTFFWVPRISVILFVILMYVIVMNDFLTLLYRFPVLYNFFIGTVMLAVIFIIWQRNSQKSGIFFILASLAYFFLMKDRLLITSVLATSVWLILTGILFLFDFSKTNVNRT